MANIFQQLEIEAFRAGITPRTKESIAWFRKKLVSMRRYRPSDAMQDDQVHLKNRPNRSPFGAMYMFFYNPKHRVTLPYYDSFPLVVMYGPAKEGFYGLNLHYMPPIIRAKVLDALLGSGGVPGKYIKPMIKHYLTRHVVGRFALVEQPEWEIATFLPTVQWEKSTATQVYRDSRKLIGA